MWDLLARLPRIVVSVRLGAVDQSIDNGPGMKELRQ
jgi:hypothetical protein